MAETNIHPLTEQTISDFPQKKHAIKLSVVRIVLLSVFVLGAATGFVIATFGPKTTSLPTDTSNIVEVVQTEKSAGIIDKNTFTDTTTGMLREGGLDGEGSFHLERGAKDQTAYLTSSTLDLSKFVGKRVTVWGQTYQSEKAGWLMDVGYIEVAK